MRYTFDYGWELWDTLVFYAFFFFRKPEGVISLLKQVLKKLFHV